MGAGGRRAELGRSSQTNPSALWSRAMGGPASSATLGRACTPSLPTATLLKGKPVCQDVRWVIRDLQGWAHSASLFLPFYSNEGALVGKGAVQATGKHQGTLEGMSKCRSNPACIKCLSRLLQGWWGAGRTGRQQSYCRATTNTRKSSGKAESPWACAMLQLQAAGEPSQGSCSTEAVPPL